MKKLVVAVGDLHGCVEEFQELLKILQYNKDQMRLVLLGDLVDRGPDSVGCVRLAREMQLEAIQGNHEEKHIRWKRNEIKRLESGKPNLMRKMSFDKINVQNNLSDDDFKWLNSLPLKLNLFDNFWAVHGGCNPNFTLEKQPADQIIRIRYVDSEGKSKPLGEGFSQPPNTKYWSEVWTGPESIVYGHCVHSLEDPRFDNHNNYLCLGIDTGCVFGGRLTAAVFGEKIEFVQVNAHTTYWKDRYNE
jgi:bis(5'-nucleosyl)-tetraphosphatase (symmetrical)